MTIELPRRGFLLGLMAAPVIVRAASLMPISNGDIYTGRPRSWHKVLLFDGLTYQQFPTIKAAAENSSPRSTIYVASDHVEYCFGLVIKGVIDARLVPADAPKGQIILSNCILDGEPLVLT